MSEENTPESEDQKHDKDADRIVAVVQVEIAKPIGRTWDELGNRLSDLESVGHRLLNAAVRDMALVDAVQRIEWLNNPRRSGTGKRAPLDPAAGLTDEPKPGTHLRTIANRAVSLELERNRDYWQQIVPTAHKALLRAKSEREAQMLRRDVERAERRATMQMPGAMASSYADLAFAQYMTYRKAKTGERSLPSFRRGCPILFRSDMVHVHWIAPTDGRPGGYVLQLALGAKDTWELAIVPMGGSAHATMRNVTGGDQDWKALDCKLVRKDSKWFAKLTYSRPRPTLTGDPNVVCAVHLGVRNALTIACSDGRAQILDTGAKLLHVKAQMIARRRRLGEASKNGSLGEGARGHGTPRRFERLEKIDDAEKRFTKTQIQQWASACVRRAKLWGAGTLVLEDYSPRELADSLEDGFVQRLIRRFPLAALRETIKFVAQREGLKTVVHTAAYIHHHCPACGTVSQANDTGAELFTCVECGHKRPADIVAAVNYVQFFLKGAPPGATPPKTKTKRAKKSKVDAEAAE